MKWTKSNLHLENFRFPIFLQPVTVKISTERNESSVPTNFKNNNRWKVEQKETETGFA
jgi:hypothetical protein